MQMLLPKYNDDLAALTLVLPGIRAQGVSLVLAEVLNYKPSTEIKISITMVEQSLCKKLKYFIGANLTMLSTNVQKSKTVRYQCSQFHFQTTQCQALKTQSIAVNNLPNETLPMSPNNLLPTILTSSIFPKSNNITHPSRLRRALCFPSLPISVLA